MRKHVLAAVAMLSVVVGYVLLRGGGRAEHQRMNLFAQECQKLITREDFEKACPNGAAKEKFRIATFADAPERSYRCGVVTSAKRTIGMTMLVYVLENGELASQRVWAEIDSSTSQRGNVLGFDETSIANMRVGTPVLFAARGRAFIDITDSGQALCTPEQRIEIGRLLYQRVPDLEKSVAPQG